MEQYLIEMARRAAIDLVLQQPPPINIVVGESGVLTAFQSAVLVDGKVYYCTSKVPTWHKAYNVCADYDPYFVGDDRA